MSLAHSGLFRHFLSPSSLHLVLLFWAAVNHSGHRAATYSKYMGVMSQAQGRHCVQLLCPILHLDTAGLATRGVTRYIPPADRTRGFVSRCLLQVYRGCPEGVRFIPWARSPQSCALQAVVRDLLFEAKSITLDLPLRKLQLGDIERTALGTSR